MRASSIISLYEFEDAIETAVKALMTTNSITAYRQRDTTTVVTPYVDIQLTAGGGIEHYHGFTDGSRRPDVFSGSLAVGIVTDRGVNAVSHSTFRATVRNIIAGFMENINPLLSYHAILNVLEAGTSPTLLTEENQDRSVVNFAIQFCIRTDAWPNVFTPTN